MKFEQKVGVVNSLETSIEFLATGFKYRFRENVPFEASDKRDLFFNYSLIRDDEIVLRYKRRFISVLYVVVAVLILFSDIAFVSSGLHIDLIHPAVIEFFGKYQTLIFWAYVAGMITFYRTVILKKVIRIGTSGDGYISLLVDTQTKDIIAELKKRRKAYMRDTYLKDKNSKERLTAETVDWLFSSNVIDSAEYNELVELVRKNVGEKDNAVGFETKE